MERWAASATSAMFLKIFERAGRNECTYGPLYFLLESRASCKYFSKHVR